MKNCFYRTFPQISDQAPFLGPNLISHFLPGLIQPRHLKRVSWVTIRSERCFLFPLLTKRKYLPGKLHLTNEIKTKSIIHRACFMAFEARPCNNNYELRNRGNILWGIKYLEVCKVIFPIITRLIGG